MKKRIKIEVIPLTWKMFDPSDYLIICEMVGKKPVKVYAVKHKDQRIKIGGKTFSNILN